MNFETWFKKYHPNIAPHSALAVLQLAGEGATVPFISRYRKEMTGNLDEVAIQNVIDGKETWEQILKRQAFILGEIEHQQKLNPELKEKITATFDLATLEDLYLPYKQKRKTKATLAKEAGLEPLAKWIWQCGHGELRPEPGQTLKLWAETYKNPQKEITEATDAIQGAQDIITERIAECLELRELTRKTVFAKGLIKSGKAAGAKEHSKFERYFDYQESIASLMRPENSHRYLAVQRGVAEKELRESIGSVDETNGYEQDLARAFEMHALTVRDFDGVPTLLAAARLALKVYVLASIENEVHKELKTVADTTAIKVFAENVRKLLLASPFGAKAVLGIDPGIRTGCKLAVVDGAGKYVASNVMHTQTDAAKKEAAQMIVEVVKKANINAIAIGNGTAGRETETFTRAILKCAGITIPVVMVSESGASVYSASAVAREEFPHLDVTVRGAISIARRLQDALAELVKVEPQSIGVGQYQHDVTPAALKKSLDQVVDSCVNSVGVNLNTASYHLLAHVSGIGPALAKAVVQRRSTKGLFKARQELLSVPRFSEKVFEQAAGFLRISDGDNPLDNTGVHPERYVILADFAKSVGKNLAELTGSGIKLVKESKELAQKIGKFTFDDIVKELEKPGRDPRAEFAAFSFREDINAVADLKAGMRCPGIVTNVTNFGAFVDIGVHQDGLAHISQLADRFVKDPREVVSPGDHVNVKILEVNLEKNQIALTLRGDAPTRTNPVEMRSRAPLHPQQGPTPQHAPPRNQSGKDFRSGAPRPESRSLNPPRQPQAFNNPFAVLAGKFPRK